MLQQQMPNFSSSPRLPSEEELYKLTSNQKHTVLVVDDCNVSQNPVFQRLFSVLGHHLKLTVFLLTQSFGGDKIWSNVHKSTHTYIIMASPKSTNAILSLGRQLGKYHFFKNVFENISSRKFNYFIIQLHPESNPLSMFMTSILRDDPDPPTVYLP